MAESILWPLSPHTRAKHQILRRYLGGWFPKLASWNDRVVFIDGFAGPGRYQEGEFGSPLIALDVASNHRYDFSDNHLVFLFIEEDKGRYDHLNETISDFCEERGIGNNFRIDTRHGSFTEHISEVWESLNSENGKSLPPAFVMIDPFGVRGIPYDVVKNLAKGPQTEVLVSFMYENMNRFITSKEFEPHLDAMFATAEWREAISLSGRGRFEFLSELYDRQLGNAGFYVASFVLRDEGNRLEYVLKFGTQHREGMALMKDAMHAVDMTGEYEFSDARAGQLRLFPVEPDHRELASLLVEKYAGTSATIEEIVEWAVLYTRTFRQADVRPALKILENDRKILSVEKPNGKRRRNTYPERSRIAFA